LNEKRQRAARRYAAAQKRRFDLNRSRLNGMDFHDFAFLILPSLVLSIIIVN
jgi:hypothetical protein